MQDHLEESKERKACAFKRSWLGECSGLQDPHYGYSQGKPCVFLRMNRVSMKNLSLLFPPTNHFQLSLVSPCGYSRKCKQPHGKSYLSELLSVLADSRLSTRPRQTNKRYLWRKGKGTVIILTRGPWLSTRTRPVRVFSF